MTSSEAPVLVTAQTVLVIDDDYALGAALASLVCRLCVPLCLCGKRSSPQRHRDVRREAEIRGATAVLPTIDDVLGDSRPTTIDMLMSRYA
jgi:hypothetical protein